jgi:hypothetical protein
MMPKCQDYIEAPEVRQVTDGPCYNWPICDYCHGHGWLPFWSEAERAGLKAMGLYLKHEDMATALFEIPRKCFREAIAIFVQAARAVKEGKDD